MKALRPPLSKATESTTGRRVKSGTGMPNLRLSIVTKLTLLAIAGVNAALFHTVAYRGVAAWDTGTRAPFAARAQAAISLALWVSIITCGRLIAYT